MAGAGQSGGQEIWNMENLVLVQGFLPELDYGISFHFMRLH